MNINTFLNHHRYVDGDELEKTHTSLQPGGKYHIANDEKKQFYQIYNNARKGGETLSIVELQTTTMIPLIVDIDLNIEVDAEENEANLSPLYKEVHVKEIMEAFFHVLKQSLDPLPESSNLNGFVMERDGYLLTKQNKTLYKNGFHIHFPKIIMSRRNIRQFIIPKVIDYLRENSCRIPSMVTYDNLFDLGIYEGKGKPWFLYGSTKPNPLSLQPYLTTHVFVEKNEMLVKETKWEKYLIDYELTHTSDEDSLDNCLVEIFSLQCEDKSEDYYFDMNEDAVQMNILCDNDTQDDLNLEEMVLRRPFDDTAKEYSFFNELIDILPNEYSEDYDKWMKIGFIIYNYFDGTAEGFEVFDNFSKKSTEKYNYEECRKKWNSMNRQKTEVGMGSLRFIVRTHNPEKYAELCSKYTDTMIESLLHNTTHFDLAKVLYHEFQDIFVCSNIKYNDWYEFKDHVWQKNDEGIFLRKKLSTFLVSKYEKLLLKYMNQEKDSTRQQIENVKTLIDECSIDLERNTEKLSKSIYTDSQKKRFEKDILKIEAEITGHQDKLVLLEEEMKGKGTDKSQKKKSENELNIERCQKIIFNLKTSPFKRNIMKEAEEIFFDPEFERKLNSDISKVAFNNGVYCLKDHKFRDGMPSDYIGLKMKVNYRPEFTMESPEVLDILSFFEKIFPNPEIRRYFLGIQSEIFWGRNTRKLFQLWIGKGDNGKSVTQKLFEELLGPLCVILPSSLLTGKRTASSSASPELVRAGQGCRLCFMQEPNKTDKFNVGLLKELSGNDKFYARALHRDPIDINPMFKLVCTANHAPIVENSQTDEAVWNRIKLIPFESYFPKRKEEVPLTVEEQFEKKIFPRDDNFSDKIESMLEGLAYLLLHIYRTGENVSYTNCEPELVSLGTKNFRNKCDSIAKFMDMEIEILKDQPEFKLDIKKFYTRYRSFMRENLPQSKVPPLDEVEEYLETNLGGRDENNKWDNIRFKDENF